MKNKCIQLTVDGAVGFFPKEFIEKAVGKQISKAVNYISEEYNDEGLVYAETSCPICDTPLNLSKMKIVTNQYGKYLKMTEKRIIAQ